VELMVWLCVSDQLPNPADATAAHIQSSPAINMASQYESGREAACRVPGALVDGESVLGPEVKVRQRWQS